MLCLAHVLPDSSLLSVLPSICAPHLHQCMYHFLIYSLILIISVPCSICSPTCVCSSTCISATCFYMMHLWAPLSMPLLSSVHVSSFFYFHCFPFSHTRSQAHWPLLCVAFACINALLCCPLPVSTLLHYPWLHGHPHHLLCIDAFVVTGVDPITIRQSLILSLLWPLSSQS